MTYALPNRTAASRLELLAEIYDPWTQRHIEALGLARGARVWEVGAGGPSIPAWLAARGATVLATDIDISQLVGLPPAVEVREHELGVEPPPADGFDLVHARLVLTHVEHRMDALVAMVAALRPGGWLLVEEADVGMQRRASFTPGPAGVRASLIRDRFRALLATEHADVELGSKLPHMLSDAGVRDVVADAFIAMSHPASIELERRTIAAVRDRLLEHDEIRAEQLHDHLLALDIGALSIAQPALVSVWGRKP